MNFTEAGITLMTVKEVWGCVLAAGVPQDGTWQLSCLDGLQSLQNIQSLRRESTADLL